jgi:hypothetical protein
MGGTSFAAEVGPPVDGGPQVAWTTPLGTPQVTALAVNRMTGQTAFVGPISNSGIQVTVLDTTGAQVFLPYSIAGTGTLQASGVAFLGPSVAVVGSFSGMITAASLQSSGGNELFFLEVCH